MYRQEFKRLKEKRPINTSKRSSNTLSARLKRWWRPHPVAPSKRESALHDWYRTELGRSLAAAERERVMQVLDNGYHPFVVQLDVGLHQPLFCAEELKCKSSLLISRYENVADCPVAQADLEHLPLQPDSVDTLIVHHALEYADQPHRVLREAVQALRPGGHLTVFGFNPYGFWGWVRWLHWRRQPLPWAGEFLSLSRVADWCELLDCGAVQKECFYYWPPLSRSHLSGVHSHRGRLIGRLLRKALPILGGVYVLVVRKNQLEMLGGHRWQPAFFLKGKVMSKHSEQAVNRWKS
ncbi:MAG: class I SAM-dependent methyltransferase [Natronospirillum sp.]